MTDRFLPGVPAAQVEAIFNAAPGNEISTGKFDSPESSAALAANTFGFFLNRPTDLPPLPGCDFVKWPASSVTLEATLRLPLRSRYHPVLDILVTTPTALIGIESKRFEPFRAKRIKPIPDSYWRPRWGNHMKGFEVVRDRLRRDEGQFTTLDETQLFKHAFALRTQVNRESEYRSLTPVLFYLYAEPHIWPQDGEPVDPDAKDRHRQEIRDFARRVQGDEVTFVSCSYRELLSAWQESGTPKVRSHAEAVMRSFAP